MLGRVPAGCERESNGHHFFANGLSSNGSERRRPVVLKPVEAAATRRVPRSFRVRTDPAPNTAAPSDPGLDPHATRTSTSPGFLSSARSRKSNPFRISPLPNNSALSELVSGKLVNSHRFRLPTAAGTTLQDLSFSASLTLFRLTIADPAPGASSARRKPEDASGSDAARWGHRALPSRVHGLNSHSVWEVLLRLNRLPCRDATAPADMKTLPILFWCLAAAISLILLRRRLPLQNVAAIAALTGGTGAGLALWCGEKNLPCGFEFVSSGAFEDPYWSWCFPFFWIATTLTCREVARLLSHARSTQADTGLRTLGFGSVLVAAFCVFAHALPPVGAPPVLMTGALANANSYRTGRCCSSAGESRP